MIRDFIKMFPNPSLSIVAVEIFLIDGTRNGVAFMDL